MPRVSRRLPGEDLVFGVLGGADGATPTLTVTSSTLMMPTPTTPPPLMACPGSGSFDVIGDSNNEMILAVCSNGDLVADGNNAPTGPPLVPGSASEVRGQGAEHPSTIVWAAGSQVWLGNIFTDSGIFGDSHMVDPSSAASGLAFDVMPGSPEQFLIAYSTGNGVIRYVTAGLDGSVGLPFHSITQTEAASPRLPLSVASAPGTPARVHPVYAIAYTSLASGQPTVALQVVDEHGEPFGVPLGPTQLPSHAAAVAYDPEFDLFAMTWIGPQSSSALSDELLQIAFVSCPQ